MEPGLVGYKIAFWVVVSYVDLGVIATMQLEINDQLRCRLRMYHILHASNTHPITLYPTQIPPQLKADQSKQMFTSLQHRLNNRLSQILIPQNIQDP